jgi:hypothetical protein
MVYPRKAKSLFCIARLLAQRQQGEAVVNESKSIIADSRRDVFG